MYCNNTNSFLFFFVFYYSVLFTPLVIYIPPDDDEDPAVQDAVDEVDNPPDPMGIAGGLDEIEGGTGHQITTYVLHLKILSKRLIVSMMIHTIKVHIQQHGRQ